MVERLALVGLVQTAVAAFVAARLGARRDDALAMLALFAATGLALILAQPLVATSDYTDYAYYLHAVGAIDAVVPVRPMFAWIARGTHDAATLWWTCGFIAASLPALAYLAARAAGGPRTLALASGAALALSAPLLVHAADANPVTPFAWAVTASALAVEAFLRAPGAAGGWAALGLGAALASGAFQLREEAMFLPAVLAVSLAASGRLSRGRKAAALAAWVLAVAALHLAQRRLVPGPYEYLAGRVDEYSRRIGHQSVLFLATNGAVAMLGLAVWDARRRGSLVRELAAPLLLPAVAYAVVYANGSAAQEHQVVVLPLLLPRVLLALAEMRGARPRIARAVATVLALWVFGSTAVITGQCALGPKRHEYTDLERGVPRGATVYYPRYVAFQCDPAMALATSLDATVPIAALAAPPGCPENLFAALSALHARCVDNHAPLERCQDAVEHAGPGWAAQALALARMQGLRAGTPRAWFEMRRSKWYFAAGRTPRGTRGPDAAGGAIGAAPAPGEAFFFVPFWAHEGSNANVPPARFTMFRWLDAASLVLDLGGADPIRASQSLMRARVRSADEAASRCADVRATPAGRALFELLEAPAATDDQH